MSKDDTSLGSRAKASSRRAFLGTLGVAGFALLGTTKTHDETSDASGVTNWSRTDIRQMPTVPQEGTTPGRSPSDSEDEPEPLRSITPIMEATVHETPIHAFDSGRPGPTTLVVGGMHGDEASGYTAANQIATWRVDSGALYVIPEANSVAIARNKRVCDHGDLNRAFPPTGGRCDHWVAQAVWDAVDRIAPDFTFDLHASVGIYGRDAGVGQAIFPTQSTPAPTYASRTATALNNHFGLSGNMQYSTGNVLDADRPMLMHRIEGVLERPGYICETYRRGGTALGDQVDWHKFSVAYTMDQYGQIPLRSTG